MKESYGDLEQLNELGKHKQNSFTIEQMLDEHLKNVGGESRKEVTDRMEKAFNRILSENSGRNIAIVSHGASIKFLLMKWCSLNKDNQLEFKKKEIKLNSPGVLKLVFDDENLVELAQIV
jgi:broad specificity phosphatase PhoE